jgi:hypothetical protein
MAHGALRRLFYHIYISEGHVSANGYRQYSIRFKDVRHARNKWQHTTSSAPKIDTLHPGLEWCYERKMIGALRSEIYRDTREVRLASAEPNAQPRDANEHLEVLHCLGRFPAPASGYVAVKRSL